MAALILVVVVGLGVSLYTQRHTGASVQSFASCTSQPGSKELETSPAICITRDGKRFTESQTALTAAAYPLERTKYIAGFDAAPDTLKQALVTTYFEPAEAACLANDRVDPHAPDDMYYLTVHTVAGSAAQVRFCPDTADSVLVHTSKGWQNVGSLIHPLPCTTVAAYRISKQITPTCTDAGGKSQPVTNS